MTAVAQIRESIPQTSFVVIAFAIGFLVFITIKGELPAYKQAIIGGPVETQAGATTTGNATPSGAGLGSPAPGKSTTFAG